MCLSLDWSNRVDNGAPCIAVSQSNGHISTLTLTNDELKVLFTSSLSNISLR